MPLSQPTAWVLCIELCASRFHKFDAWKESREVSQRQLLNEVERGAESSACSLTIRAVRPTKYSNQGGTSVKVDAEDLGISGVEWKEKERQGAGNKVNALQSLISAAR